MSLNIIRKLSTEDYRYKGLRKKLVQLLRTRGISDERILDAIGIIPRHRFLDHAFAEWAYKDVAFPIGSDQTISQPYTVAYQTFLLDVEQGHKVLEIGTGSGYQATVLAELGAKVYSIERQSQLFDRTEKLLKQLGYGRIRVYLRDGMKGLPRFAPFDRILVTAGARSVPEALKEQLTIGGKLVIPVGPLDHQKMLRIIRKSVDEYETETFENFKFVPLLGGISQ